MWSKLVQPSLIQRHCAALSTGATWARCAPPPPTQSFAAPHSTTPPTKIVFPRQHDWNRAIAVAERLVGFPTSMLHIHAVMNDEVSSMVTHMRKLMGSDHPVLKTLKRLIFHEGKNNLQVRGLIMLLLSRATNLAAVGQQTLSDLDGETGITTNQRKLAEYVEMILAAQAIHKSVLNLPHDLHTEPDEILRDDLLQLEYGNKIAILGGDYLLANACTGLADLRNTFVVELISISIAEFTQAEFLGHRDVQGRLVPTPESLSVESWIERNSLAYGSLLANGCKSAMLLAKQTDEVQTRAHRIGYNVALALQAYIELQPFNSDMTSGSNYKGLLDLSAAPVLFHLQSDNQLLNYIQTFSSDLEGINSKQVYDAVSHGPGVAMSKELCQSHAQKALKDIDALPEGDAKAALNTIISFLAN